MAYTFTERKRIRKSFGSRDSVLEIPYLLQMQKDAYTAFLQADVPPKKRTNEGLQAAFDAAFPIVSHNGFVEMKYLEYNLARLYSRYFISTKPLCETIGKAASKAACRPSLVRFLGGTSACKNAVYASFCICSR